MKLERELWEVRSKVERFILRPEESSLEAVLGVF